LTPIQVATSTVEIMIARQLTLLCGAAKGFRTALRPRSRHG